jgi:hypothetical protein
VLGVDEGIAQGEGSGEGKARAFEGEIDERAKKLFTFLHPKNKLEDEIVDSQQHGYLHHEVRLRGGPMIASWKRIRRKSAAGISQILGDIMRPAARNLLHRAGEGSIDEGINGKR